MRRSILVAGLAVAALLAPTAARAQLAMATTPVVDAQDSALAGIRTVYVAFNDRNNGLGNTVALLESSLTEELKRAGLRVMRGPRALEKSDAMLRIDFATKSHSAASDIAMRIDVVHLTAGAPDAEPSRTVVWSYERSASSLIADEAAPAMFASGLTEFLTKWMGMNAP